MSDSSANEAGDSSAENTTASSHAIQPDLASTTRPIPKAGDISLRGQRKDMRIRLALLQDFWVESSAALTCSNVEGEVHRPAIEVLKECRDTGTPSPYWVVRCAMDSGVMARRVRMGRNSAAHVLDDPT